MKSGGVMAKALVSGFKHLTVKMGTRYAGSSPVLTTNMVDNRRKGGIVGQLGKTST